jgi:Uma2 family endonuclease
MTTPEKIRLTGDDLLKIEAQYPDRLFELIEGELKEYPVPGWEHSRYENFIVFLLNLYNYEHQRGEILIGEVGCYTRGDNHTVRMADIAFVIQDRVPEKIPSGYGHIPPDLVVEIVSPGDSAGEIEEKIQEWLNFGVRLLWVVYPKTQRVYVYQPGSQPVILKADETITGGDILPGFSAKVIKFFEK